MQIEDEQAFLSVEKTSCPSANVESMSQGCASRLPGQRSREGGRVASQTVESRVGEPSGQEIKSVSEGNSQTVEGRAGKQLARIAR
jgi:hypothetical protein